MAFRRPIKLDGGNLRNMTDAEILLLQQEAIRQYGLAPSTTLSYSNGGGNLATIPDYRLQASANVSSSSPWPTPSAATTITVNYDHALQEREEGGAPFPQRDANSYANFSYPLYFDGGNLRAMNTQDFWDTIITPAKDYLITNEGTDDDLYRAGTYTIHTTTSLTGATLVDANPIFSDTQADITAFASGNLPESQDQSTTVQNYYLHRFNPVAGVDFVPPVVHKIDTSDVQSLPSTMYSSLAKNQIRWNVDNGLSAGGTQNKFMQYQFWPTAGAGAASLPGTFADARGSSMANTYTSAYIRRYEQPNSSTYYSQNVPTGTPTAYTTWNLIITYVDASANYQ